MHALALDRERPLWKCHGGTSAYGVSTSTSRSPRSLALPPLVLYLTTLGPSPLALLYVACKSQQSLLPSLSVLLATPTRRSPLSLSLPATRAGATLPALASFLLSLTDHTAATTAHHHGHRRCPANALSSQS